MKITDVNVRKFDKGKLRGFASFTLSDEDGVDKFVITDAKIFEGSRGLFVGFPSKKVSDGEYKDICFPITTGMREKITSAIITEFENTDGNTKRISKPQEDVDDLPF